MADPRTYIRVHDGMPDHPKIDGLSDAAFRLLVTTWCWCSRHLTDGHVPAATWRKRGTPKTRRELVDAGLFEEAAGGVRLGVMVHDYLEHQRSAEEVQEIRDAKGRGGAFGNHVRWHIRRRRSDPDCEFCAAPEADPEDLPDGSQDRSDQRSQDRSEDRSHDRDGVRSQTGNDGHNKGLDNGSTEPYSEHGFEDPSNAPTSEDAENGIANGSHNRSQTDRKTSPETVSETETEVLMADVGESSSVRTTAAHDDDDDPDSKIDKWIIELIAEQTGRDVSAEHAAKTRRQILGGRTVNDPAAYVAAAIRGAPRDFLPGAGDPPSTPVRQALRDVMPDADAGPPAEDPPDTFRAARDAMRGRRPA